MRLLSSVSVYKTLRFLLAAAAAAVLILAPWLLKPAAFIMLLALPPLYYLHCLYRLKSLSASGLDETADFLFGEGELLAGTLQKRSEIIGFLKETFPEAPRAVAEIGRAKGGTLALICRSAAPDALVISLDLPGAIHSGPVPFLNKGTWRLPLLKAMAGPGQDLRLIDGDSKETSSVERFAAALGGRKLDLLFIDGDHTWEGVSSDYRLYSPFVRPGGVIAFHDIQPGLENLDVAVSRFWKESALPGERKEFIEDREQLSCGIGVLRLPGGTEEAA